MSTTSRVFQAGLLVLFISVWTIHRVLRHTTSRPVHVWAGTTATQPTTATPAQIQPSEELHDLSQAIRLVDSDVECYADRYPGLRAQFGNDLDRIREHYFTLGIAQGRDPFCRSLKRLYLQRPEASHQEVRPEEPLPSESQPRSTTAASMTMSFVQPDEIDPLALSSGDFTTTEQNEYVQEAGGPSEAVEEGTNEVRKQTTVLESDNDITSYGPDSNTSPKIELPSIGLPRLSTPEPNVASRNSGAIDPDAQLVPDPETNPAFGGPEQYEPVSTGSPRPVDLPWNVQTILPPALDGTSNELTDASLPTQIDANLWDHPVFMDAANTQAQAAYPDIELQALESGVPFLPELPSVDIGTRLKFFPKPFIRLSPADGSCGEFHVNLSGKHRGWLTCGDPESGSENELTFLSHPEMPATRNQQSVIRITGQDDGWATLELPDKPTYALEMRPPERDLGWVIKLARKPTGGPLTSQKFAVIPVDGENAVRLYNRALKAFVNVVPGPHHAVRGHGTADGQKSMPAGPEPSTKLSLSWLASDSPDESPVDSSFQTDSFNAEGVARNQDWDMGLPAEVPKNIRMVPYYQNEESKYIDRIMTIPTLSEERRVISFGLYGNKPKYLVGAVRNTELANIYFPGWNVRFYLSTDVPKSVVKQLKQLGAEIIKMEAHNGIAGMFWRFMVADDQTVDRYIVRDTDSRLNPRDRFAVEEWIESGKGIHSIRDHPNHKRFLNGGLWGGTRNAIPENMEKLIQKWGMKMKYGGDLKFLCQVVWPLIKDDQISHDAYSCTAFPNAYSFPTKRPKKYQHVGQVFDENDNPRMGDIDDFIRKREVPPQCRRQIDWIFG